MADYDRYLAACEDREADRIRRYDDEREAREARMTRESDLYAKHAGDVDLLMEGINPDTGLPMQYSDEGELVEVDGGDDDWECDQDRDREMEDR